MSKKKPKKASKWLPCWQSPPAGFKGGKCVGRRNHQRNISVKHMNLKGEEWT